MRVVRQSVVSFSLLLIKWVLAALRYMYMPWYNSFCYFQNFECSLYSDNFFSFFFLYPRRNIHLLRKFRFSSRAIIKLWSWPHEVTGLGLLTTRLVISGKSRPVDVAQIVYPLVPTHDSPIVANLCMEFFEQHAVSTLPVTCAHWLWNGMWMTF